MSRIGTYTVEEARDFKALLLQLRAAGFMIQGGQKQPALTENVDEVLFYNDTDETIPPFGVVQVVDCAIQKNRPIVKVKKANDSYGRYGPYLVNGPREIPIYKNGIGYRGCVVVQGVDTTYTLGDRLKVEPYGFGPQYQVRKHPCGNWFCVGKFELRDQDDLYFAVDVGYPQVVDFVVATSPLGAATGTTTLTMGYQDCAIWKSNTALTIPYGTVGTITASGSTERIYNKFAESIPVGARGIASLDGDGLWRAISWSCS